jgi:formate-dependent nitrite reductase membrane component NrfD
MDLMSYSTQDVWTSWIAVYLFFGGLGAATLSVTFLTDMYMKPHRALVIWGAWSGVVMLGLGSLMLFGHLLHHAAVIHVLNPLILFYKPDAWIAWGTQFIIWMMFWGALYSLPHLRACSTVQKRPLLRWALDRSVVRWASDLCGRHCRLCGWMATINGIGTAVYTGLLLQSFPAVALWHNPGVPLLFTVSAFSTAMAYLLIILHLVERREEDEDVRRLYERLDLVLIGAELIILFAIMHYLQGSGVSGRKSLALLFNDSGWVWGFLVLGLAAPFFLQLKGVIRGWATGAPVVLSSMLVLMGGYLLRHYFLSAGVYAYPW